MRSSSVSTGGSFSLVRNSSFFLWEDDAEVEPTSHLDILKATESEQEEGNLKVAAEALERAVKGGERFWVEAILCAWILTFTPALSPEGMTQPETSGATSGKPFQSPIGSFVP